MSEVCLKYVTRSIKRSGWRERERDGGTCANEKPTATLVKREIEAAKGGSAAPPQSCPDPQAPPLGGTTCLTLLVQCGLVCFLRHHLSNMDEKAK